jgi:glyoxylase-like metal-dependent hydrolase (beta-lactamase superfamily II)
MRHFPRLGLVLLTAATAAAGPFDPPRPPAVAITYEGTVWLEAHFRRPGECHEYRSRQVFRTDGRGDARLDWFTWQPADTAPPEPETILVFDHRVFHRDAPGTPWVEYSGAAARNARFQAWAGLPAILTGARRGLGGVAEPQHWSRSDGRLLGYTRRKAHPRLGDVCDSVAYAWDGRADAPESVATALYLRDENWRARHARTSCVTGAQPDSLFAVPVGTAPAVPDEDGALGPVRSPVERAPGIWSFDLDDIDSRTVVAEFADHVAVIESAVGSDNGERLVDAIRIRWPAKPIRYALFSHHHPHYTGGLRAFIDAGATVVTTPGNDSLVHAIAARRFSLAPDRLARHLRPVRVVTYADSLTLGDATNRVVLYDYGARSQHADEFTVFWFPRQRLLFESELGWGTAGGAPRASRRAKALLAWAAARHLDVETVLQGWPERDTEAAMSRATLDSLVAARK